MKDIIKAVETLWDAKSPNRDEIFDLIVQLTALSKVSRKIPRDELAAKLTAIYDKYQVPESLRKEIPKAAEVKIRKRSGKNSKGLPEKMVLWRAVSKYQAKQLGIGWELTSEEYEELWKDHWHLKGRKPGGYIMVRKDRSKPWTVENTELRMCSNKITTPDGVFGSVKEAAEHYNVTQQCINMRIKKTGPKWAKWRRG